MKIVVCDDSLEYLLKIEKLLLKYQELNPGRNFEIEKYSDALKLCNKIQKKEIADVYILDIIMSDTTGIDIGNLLKKTKEGCVIIYITSSDDFALEAYGVHAIRYLLKPVKEEHFFEALDYAMSYTETKKDALYLVKTKDGLVSVPYGKIEYIENVSRIFEKGFTGSNGRARGQATGMGLYLCRKLCGRLGIGLRAESKYGSGTRMLLHFPVGNFTGREQD